MPSLLTTSPDNPEFARVVAVAALRRGSEFRFDIAPDPAEAAAVAALLGAQAIRKLRFVGLVKPEDDGFALEGELGATAVQTCVVTLDPVTTRLDVPVRRRFQPVRPPRGDEIEIDSLEDDDLEPLGDRIDLGLVAIEALALALPAYPRSEGAALSDARLAELRLDDDPADRPFAGLAALRGRMRDDG